MQSIWAVQVKAEEAMRSSEEAEAGFRRRKEAIQREILNERQSQRRTISPVELDVITDTRMGKDAVAKKCLAENRWHIDRAAMYSSMATMMLSEKIMLRLAEIAPQAR